MGLFGSAISSDVLLPEGVRRNAKRRGEELKGAFFLVIGLIIAVALATWSVQDPSLNHAADRIPQNLLGYPGAVIADLLMQVFGLGAVVMIFPLLLWGWRYLRHRPADNPRGRAAASALALLAAIVFAATLPVPASWPLPTGLGGFLGDTLRSLPDRLLGVAPTLFSNALIGLLGLASLALCLTYGLDARLIDHLTKQRDPLDEFVGADADAYEEELDEDDDARSAWLGALTHAALSLPARLRRLRGRATAPPARAANRAANWADQPQDEPGRRSVGTRLWRLLLNLLGFASERADEDPFAAERLPDGRIEPRFADLGASGGDPLGDADPAFDGADPPVPAGEAVNVAGQRLALKQGRRIVREAQPSLLPSADYALPPLRLLSKPSGEARKTGVSKEALEQNARMLEGVLEDFGIRGTIINVRPGPVVTLYELEPAPGIKSSRVIGLADDIARSMSAISARVAVVAGRNAIGIELPNSIRETVHLREILASEEYERSRSKLPLTLGKTIGGEPVITDLARMPHLLIAGTTGSGKSVGINAMILSLLYRLSPDRCKLIMVDPKMLELSVYDGIPHLLAPVVTDPKKAVVALKWTVREMEERYKKMSKLGVRNIDGFNQRVREAAESGEVISRMVQTGFDRETGQAIYETEEMELEAMPYLVVIVDEMADLMMVAGKDIEGAIQRLAQMARAAGIHLIMATQRPSVDVITGTIKANFPTRISFQVTSKIDSRTILGEQGAEQLLGQGDMLYMAGGGRISRVHGPFVSDGDVEAVVKHLKRQGAPDYLDAVTLDDEDGGGGFDAMSGLAGGGDGDELYQKALEIVLRDQKASTSYIQRRLSIGYNRAATIIERMENEGIVSPANHAGKREILLGSEE